MGKSENVFIFEDTEKTCKDMPSLSLAIKQSREMQDIFWGRHPIPHAEVCDGTPAQIIVSRKRTLEAAKAYTGKKVCVLNFASATNPGGGVTRGSSAQEEAICRCSTLYPCLNNAKMWNSFYVPHRHERDPLYNDDCIYTPGVVVFKTDDDVPKHMPESQWYCVDVLTCAAPNLRNIPTNAMNPSDGSHSISISNEDLQKLHEKRMERVFQIAMAKGAEVLILGAFGCGAFRNPPEVVAAAMKTIVQKYRNAFDTIEFAVYCLPRRDHNYHVFNRVFKEL